jgi:hypothetical protein
MFMHVLPAIDANPALENPSAPGSKWLGASGLLRGTLVETDAGWRPVQSLVAGQTVQTLDGGLAPMVRLDRRQIRPRDKTVLIGLPGGCLDACCDLVLLPGQHLLVDALDDPVLGGAPFALVPALALAAMPGPRRLRPTAPFDAFIPLFAEEEAIYAQSGVLFHCPGLINGVPTGPEASFFPLLDLDAARAFLQRRAARLG